MSTPVRGADGPLGYAPRWARGSGSGRADTALDSRTRGSTPVQELPQDLKPPRVVGSARDVVPPRDVISPRDAVTGRDVLSARDTTSMRDTASVRDTSPLADAAFEPSAEPPREPTSHWDTKPSRAPVAAPAAAPDALWKRKKRPVVFEGDAALRELRSRLASAPDQTPEPPLYHAKTPIFAAVARLVGVMVLAAVGALGFLWITSPRGAPPPVASKPGSGDVALVAYPYRGLEAQPKPPFAAESTGAQRAPDAPPSGSPWAVANYNTTDAAVGTPPVTLAPRAPGAPRPFAPSPASRVTTPPPPVLPTPAATAPTPPPAVPPPAAVAMMPPPVAPASITAPPPSASVPASKAPQPAIAAPVPALPSSTPPAAASDRDEIAGLLARARTYLAAGDVAAARLVLRRAAERDDPQAALALGGTYDPIVLKRLGIVNFQADPAQAKDWYRRAAQLGSADASLRLEQLAQTDH
jgi:hypothetical protein